MGDHRSEGSETTKVGSNKQSLPLCGERDTEAKRVGVSKHDLSRLSGIIVKPREYQKALLVDQVDIDRKNLPLPR